MLHRTAIFAVVFWISGACPAFAHHAFPGKGNETDWIIANSWFERSLKESDATISFAAVEKAIQNYADDPAYYCQAANLQLRRGENERALMQIRTALSINPKCARAWFEYGRYLSTQGNIPSAIKAFETSVHLDSRDPAAWLKLGEYYGLTNAAKEESAYKRCLDEIDSRKKASSDLVFEPDEFVETVCLMNLAGLKANLGYIAEAKRLYEKAEQTTFGSAYHNVIQEQLEKLNCANKVELEATQE